MSTVGLHAAAFICFQRNAPSLVAILDSGQYGSDFTRFFLRTMANTTIFSGVPRRRHQVQFHDQQRPANRVYSWLGLQLSRFKRSLYSCWTLKVFPTLPSWSVPDPLACWSNWAWSGSMAYGDWAVRVGIRRPMASPDRWHDAAWWPLTVYWPHDVLNDRKVVIVPGAIYSCFCKPCS